MARPVCIRKSSAPRRSGRSLSGSTSMRIPILALAVALLSGCKDTTKAPVVAVGPQAGLVGRIAYADHVVVTNRYAGTNDPELMFSVRLSGKKADKAVRAVALGQPLRGVGTYCSYSWELQFFNGTNHLGDVDFQGEFFWDRETEYVDHTGVIDALYETVEHQRHLRELRLQGRL